MGTILSQLSADNLMQKWLFPKNGRVSSRMVDESRQRVLSQSLASNLSSASCEQTKQMEMIGEKMPMASLRREMHGMTSGFGTGHLSLGFIEKNNTQSSLGNAALMTHPPAQRSPHEGRP